MDFIDDSLKELRSIKIKIEDYSREIDLIPDGQKEEFQVVLTTELNKFQRVVHENLNYSLLTGEYISKENFQKSITDLKHEISALLEQVFGIQDIIGVQDITYQIVEGLSKSIELYNHFYSDILNRYSINRKDYVLTINSIIDSVYHNEKLLKDTKKFINFFGINILASKFDLFLTQDNIRLIELFSIEKSIKRVTPNGFDTLSSLIVEKCNFIRVKWFLRKQEEAPDETSFMMDGQEHLIQKNSHAQIYKEWTEYSSEHYELENNWKGRIEDNSRKLHNIELQDLSFKEIHLRIKYNKDINPDIKELEKISNYLCNKSNNFDKNQTNFFDEYALNVMSNYALNNKFSLFVEKNRRLKELQLEYSKVKRKSNKFLNNFFLEYKFLNSALKTLKYKLNSQENKDFLQEFGSFIENELKNVYEQYEFNHNWSLKRYNYIFQLPFNECKIKVDDSKTDFLFISSSFLLPPSTKKLENQFNFIKTQYSQLLNHIESIKILKTDIDKIDNLKQEIETQKISIEKNQIKFIEVLGIFTALIAFIFGSISTFEFLSSPQEFLLFNIGFALSLIAFVSILVIFIRGKDALNRNWKFLVALFILFILYWFGIIYSDFITSQTEAKQNLNSDTNSMGTAPFNSTTNSIDSASNEASNYPTKLKDSVED